MNQIQIFNNPLFGEVRVTTTEKGEPMFCLADVCAALNLNNVGKVKSRLNAKGITNSDTPTNGGVQSMVYINEANLYKCIFQSRVKKAEQFQDWVCGEVLPSIRKYGAYATPVTIDRMIADPDFAIQLLTNLKEERRKRLEMESQVAELTDKVNVLAPKAKYYDSILASPDSVVVTQIAKDYGMSPQEFNKRLYALGIQYKVNGQWVLYAKYQGEGYTDSYTGLKHNSNGTWMSTVWTQRGRLFLYTMLKEVNVLPVIERYSGYMLPPVPRAKDNPGDKNISDSYYR